MTNLVALDCETTSLRRDCRIWEIGAIARRPGREEQEYRWFIRTEDLDLGNADPFSLDIGGFYQRHPQMIGKVSGSDMPGPEADVLAEVEKVCRGAHIIGNVVNFDTQRLDTRMAAHGILWNGHYHLIDVEALAIGYLAAKIQASNGAADPGVLALPWDSEMLSAALGVKVPGEDRHTALGDARWALAMYDKVMGG